MLPLDETHHRRADGGLRRRGRCRPALVHVRGQGAGEILIGALATDPPTRLYAGLGFVPVCLTREYLKQRA